MAKKLPTPFSKPSISLAVHGKAWQTDVLFENIEVGDIIKEAGAVEMIVPKSSIFKNVSPGGRYFAMVSGALVTGDTFEAFTRQR